MTKENDELTQLCQQRDIRRALQQTGPVRAASGELRPFARVLERILADLNKSPV